MKTSGILEKYRPKTAKEFIMTFLLNMLMLWLLSLFALYFKMGGDWVKEMSFTGWLLMSLMSFLGSLVMTNLSHVVKPLVLNFAEHSKMQKRP